MQSDSKKVQNSNNKQQQYQIGGRKKTINNKSQAEKSTRRTRRKKDDQEEITLPQNIPLTQSDQIMLFQSLQKNLTSCIIQIPITLWKANQFQKIELARVQSRFIQVQIKKSLTENLVVSLKINTIQKPINLQKKIQQQQTIQSIIYNVRGKLSWITATQVQSKIIKNIRKQINAESFSEVSLINPKEVNSDIFLTLKIIEEEKYTNDYLGLINQGNTCYMNSYLQMLYHITQFRNLVYDAQIQSEYKFPATLQTLFYRLSNQQKAISPEQLIKSFGWTKKEVQVQHDAQQFSCLFFQVLENKLEQYCKHSK